VGQQCNRKEQQAPVIASFDHGLGGCHGGSAVLRLGGREEEHDDQGEERGEWRHRAEGCQPGNSSSVLAWGKVSSRVPAKGAVRCQRTKPGWGRGKDREWASHSRETGHSNGFGDDDEPERDRHVTNRGFPHQRYKPGKLRPTSIESPTP